MLKILLIIALCIMPGFVNSSVVCAGACAAAVARMQRDRQEEKDKKEQLKKDIDRLDWEDLSLADVKDKINHLLFWL